MDKKKLGRISACVVGGLATLGLLIWIGVRLYAHTGEFDDSYETISWDDYFRKNGHEILQIKGDQVEIEITEDVINTGIADFLEAQAREDILCCVYRTEDKKAYLRVSTDMGVYPVQAEADLWIEGSRIVMHMQEFRVGNRDVELPESILGTEQRWELDFSEHCPSWLSPASLKVSAESLCLYADIEWSGAAQVLQPYLEGIFPEYLALAAEKMSEGSLTSLIEQDAQAGQVSPVLAQRVMQDFWGDQSEIYAMLSLLQEDRISDVLIQYGDWLQKEADYQLLAQMQAEYRLEIYAMVARHLLTELRADFAVDENTAIGMRGVKNTPYHPLTEMLYDKTWVNTRVLPTVYESYREGMRLYREASSGHVYVFQDLNEAQVLVVHEEGYFVKNIEDMDISYPGWSEEGTQTAVTLDRQSPVRLAAEEFLLLYHETEEVHTRYMRQSGEQVFCIYSVGDEKFLRSAMMVQGAEWQIAQTDIADFEAYLAAHPETDASIFPYYTTADIQEKKLTSGGISQLRSRLSSAKYIKYGVSITHYSYIGSHLYVRLSTGAEVVLGVNEGKIGEILTLDEAILQWELPPYLYDAL